MSSEVSSPAIRLRGLTKVFELRKRDLLAVDRLDLDVGPGEFVCIVGPSGCGKTTVLRILAGLERQTSGSVDLGLRSDGGRSGRPLTSMVFQEQSVFPWMKVRDNIAFGLKCRGVGAEERRGICDRYISRVGLVDFADALPHQLSGGMKQRVSIARAFANDPLILLMDEPFASLDELTKLRLQGELLRLWEESRRTVVYITHSIDEAILLADRIVVMSARPGRVLADIAIPFARPRSLEAVRADARYGAIFGEVWRLLGQVDAPTDGGAERASTPAQPAGVGTVL